MKKTNQDGFSLLVVALIVVIVGLVGFTGWYVWNNNKSSKSVGSSQDIKLNPTPSIPVAVSPTPANTQKYLTIKEWGVKIPIEGAIADATYIITSEYSDSAYLSTASMNVKHPGCERAGYGVGAYGRFSDPNTQLLNSTYGKVYANAPKIGNYYYYFMSAQSACGTNEATYNQEAQDSKAPREAFQKAIQYVLAI